MHGNRGIQSRTWNLVGLTRAALGPLRRHLTALYKLLGAVLSASGFAIPSTPDNRQCQTIMDLTQMDVKNQDFHMPLRRLEENERKLNEVTARLKETHDPDERRDLLTKMRLLIAEMDRLVDEIAELPDWSK